MTIEPAKRVPCPVYPRLRQRGGALTEFETNLNLRGRTAAQAAPSYSHPPRALGSALRRQQEEFPVSSVQIREVRKSFGAVSIIQGVTVDISDGEFVVLVGPSGCGKSTLLRMVAGLETITAGEIAIDGRVVNKLEPKERDIAMVFQNYALYPQMTVAQNLGFALELARLGKDEIKQKVAAAAASLGLESLLGRYPRQLSGGQRQRVAMGRAIVRDPKVFLFDEPLSNLDAKLRVQVRGEIKELQRRLKTTTIYVTHDQVEAMTMGDKIVVLNGGRVEQIGAPLDLYDHPANRFVATFLGSPAMNLIEGTIDSAGTRLVLPDGHSAMIGSTPAAWAGRKVLFGIRPEAVRFDPEAALECVVSLVEPTGSETHLIAHAGETEIVAVLKERMRIYEGETVKLWFDSAQAHFFDPESGQRLSVS